VHACHENDARPHSLDGQHQCVEAVEALAHNNLVQFLSLLHHGTSLHSTLCTHQLLDVKYHMLQLVILNQHAARYAVTRR